MLEKVVELCNQYYELIPRTEFAYDKLAFFTDKWQVEKELKLLQEVFELDKTIQIVYAAYHNATKYNPYDYVFNSLPCQLRVLAPRSDMFETIFKYINANQVNEKLVIQNIFEYDLKKSASEETEFAKIKNHWLLWHGTNSQNFISIMNSGLKIAPKNATRTGQMFGEGIYFADTFNKANNYAIGEESKYFLLCEVALGKM